LGPKVREKIMAVAPIFQPMYREALAKEITGQRGSARTRSGLGRSVPQSSTTVAVKAKEKGKEREKAREKGTAVSPVQA